MMDKDNLETQTLTDRGDIPPGFPAGSLIRSVDLGAQGAFGLLVVQANGLEETDRAKLAQMALEWASKEKPEEIGLSSCPESILIPLYGSQVIWTARRGAVIADTGKLDQLADTLADFACCESRLRTLEKRGFHLLGTVERDAALSFTALETESRGSRRDIEIRHLESVAIRGELEKIAPSIFAPSIYPPTAGSQLAERLRDRTRLCDRHELASSRADFALTIYDSCGQRAFDAATARQHTGLEWAIIVILLCQMALMLVEVLALRAKT